MRRLQLHWEWATKTIHQIPRSKTPPHCQACGCGTGVECCGVVLRCYKAAGEGGKGSAKLHARHGRKERWRQAALHPLAAVALEMGAGVSPSRGSAASCEGVLEDLAVGGSGLGGSCFAQ